MKKKICVVGAGRWGKNHIRTLHGLGNLAAIVESDETVLETFIDKYPGVKGYTNLKDAIADDYDGYTVATPAETHFEIASYILNHGKPALVEKPIALTAEEARELKKLADSKNLPLMVGHVMLFHPAIRKLKEVIDDGKIGKLQYIYSNRVNLGTVRTEENILWSFAVHDISIFQYIIGDMPEKIHSDGGAFLQPHIHDTTMTTITYPDNVFGHIFVSWLHPFKEHRIVVIGNKGMLSFEDSGSKEIMFFEKGIDWVQGEPIKRDGPTEVIPYDKKMPLTEELEYFVNSIDGKMPEVCDSQNAIDILEILESASDSLLKHSPIEIKQKAEKKYFVHDSSFVDDGCDIGEGTKIWHFSHVQGNTKIGKKCSLGQNVNVGNNVKIGNFVKIQNNVSVYEGVELEDYVFCGPSMVFTNVLDPRSKYPQRGSEFYARTLVKEGASIGANATVVCGNTLGKHCFIGAGAVITSDVPDFALMYGVPAKRKGWVCECGEILGEFDSKKRCSRCGIEYVKKDDIIRQK